MNEQELRQLFQNLSDECKVVRIDGKPHNDFDGYESTKTIKLMSEDKFIETLQQAKMLIIPVDINSFLDKFEKAAKKQLFALNNGGFGHAGWCNYQRIEGNGKGICNCGISDLQSALTEYEYYKQNCL